MKSKAFHLVFDGLADWELAHSLCEINKSGKFEVVAVGFSKNVVTTMGGVKVLPDIALDEVTTSNASIFMLPGGDMWESESSEELKSLLRRFDAENIPIGAICAATLAIVRAGLTHNRRHTSNAKNYLKYWVPDYRDDDFYSDELAVSDHNIITASGLGSVEFAREVIKQLHLYDEAETETWYQMFKHGVVPADMFA
jgi:putative intracellular protease/amidase